MKKELKETGDLKGEVKKRLEFNHKPTTDPLLQSATNEQITRLESVLSDLRKDPKLMEHVRDLAIFHKSAPAVEKLAALRKLFVTDEYNTIKLERKALWFSTVKHFIGRTPEDIRINPSDVEFLDEEGIDGGGPHNEWVLKVLEEVLNPLRGLFAPTSENYLLPSRIGKSVIAYRMHYRVFGRLLAKFFIMDEAARGVPFCPYIWKLLKG